MTRPTAERLQAALSRATSPSGAVNEGDIGVLAAEVLALRRTIARAAACAPSWREEEDRHHHPERTAFSGYDCARDLEAALKGTP